MKNFYAILEVPVGSDISVIREAYRRLVQENLWNKEVFVELKEAYEVLSTPARRMEFDKSTFGQNFAVAGSQADMRLQAGTNAEGETIRRCPLDAGAQCPVLSARVPLQEAFCPECGFLLATMPPEGFAPLSVETDLTKLPRLEDTARGRVYRLRPGVNNVGREAADVLLVDKTVSRHHARIEIQEDGQVFLEDLGSTNGTRVADAVLAPHVRQPLSDEEAVRFGSISLILHLPASETLPSSGAAGEETASISPTAGVEEPMLAGVTQKTHARLVASRNGTVVREDTLVPGVTTFGRRAENTVVLGDDPYISSIHAQIIAEDETFRLTDLGSTNGTFLNGERLLPNEPATLQAGDEITFGSLTYRFEPEVTAQAGETPTGEAALRE